jgi:hypothetical protein
MVRVVFIILCMNNVPKVILSIFLSLSRLFNNNMSMYSYRMVLSYHRVKRMRNWERVHLTLVELELV